MKEESKKPKVLIVEDDFRLCRVYMIKLQKEGIDVSIAGEGNEGLRRIYAEKPDLIILDLMLPGLDGFQILDKIKKDKEVSSIPVLIMSNLGCEADVEKGLKLGAIDYIVKTETSISEVVEKIKKQL